MTEPDLACIVGAPRCGTTTLAGFLQDHPEVSFSRVKEPHFFSGRDLTNLSDRDLRTLVRTEYLDRFFEPEESRARMLAEGSVTYLYMPERMEPLLRLWPSARFVIAVRNPLDMLPSLHQRLLYIGDESVEDFASAWDLIAERRRGGRIPRSCLDPRLLFYDEIGRLGHYVERFFRAVGRDRCHVVVFDDLATDPAKAYRDLVNFLGLRQVSRPDFTPRRQGLEFRTGWLQRFLKRPPVVTRSFLAGEKFRMRIKPLNATDHLSLMHRGLFAARRHLLRLNTRPSRRGPIAPRLRHELRATFEADILHLSRLINRDLGSWIDHPALIEEQRCAA